LIVQQAGLVSPIRLINFGRGVCFKANVPSLPQ
jgi:hypothetical protein